jgi:hypothetical protein
MIRNHVYFKFAQGSEFDGAFLRLPISCRFQAGFPGLPVLPDPDEDDNEPLERILDENDMDYDEEEPNAAAEVSSLNSNLYDQYLMRTLRCVPNFLHFFVAKNLDYFFFAYLWKSMVQVPHSQSSLAFMT